MGNNKSKCNSEMSTSSVTSSRFVTARHTWKIRDFAWLMELAKEKQEVELSSGVFDVNTEVGVKRFRICLTWNNHTALPDDETRFVGAFLRQVLKDKEPPVTTKFSMAILSPKAGPFGKKTWGNHTSSIKSKERGWPTFAKKILDAGLDKEGALTIVCGIEIMTKHPAAVVEGACEGKEELKAHGEELWASTEKPETPTKEAVKPVERKMLPDEKPKKPAPTPKTSTDNIYNVI